MNLRITTILITLIILFNYGMQSEAQVKEIPPELQLFNAEIIKDIPKFWSSAMLWPSPTEIAAHRVPDAQVKWAKESTIEFIGEVLKEKYVPKDLEKRLIGTNNLFEGSVIEGKAYWHDCFLGRYQIEDYLIQIKVLLATMFVVIKKANQNRLETQSEQQDLVQQTIREFLTKSEEIEKTPYQELIVHQKSISRWPVFGQDFGIYWWNSIIWWTDGEVVVLNIFKGGKFGYDAEQSANWFEDEAKR